MKKIFTPVIISLLCVTSVLKAQSPQQMNYQAIVRDVAGTPLAQGTNVTVRFIIHDQTATGTVVFTEVNTAVTNAFGLITQVIGGTTNLSTVNWSSGPKYLEVDIDPTGGTNFADMGTTQLLSVPYALYAGNSAAGATGPTGAQGPAGSAGPTGLQGVQGVQGQAGPQGPAGANGTQGAQGPVGQQGLAGVTGSTGPAGAQGIPGLNGATGSVGSTGPDGAAGPTGIAGNTGANGVTGSTGQQGDQGPSGAGGAQGSQGPAGATGPTGDPGAQGTAGAQGATGTTGTQGSVGATGASGPQGAQGLPGATGPTGVGTTGATGPAGSTGTQGAQGLQGTAGAAGSAGATGPTGPAGTSAGNSQVSGSGSNLGITWTNVRTVTIVKASSTTKLLIEAFVSVNTGEYEFAAGRIGYVSGSSYSSGSATDVTWAQGGAFDDDGAAAEYSISTYISGLAAGTYTIGLDNDTDPDATIENSSLTVIEY